jgi:hypothetical protein
MRGGRRGDRIVREGIDWDEGGTDLENINKCIQVPTSIE